MASENIDVDCEGVSILPLPPYVALRHEADDDDVEDDYYASESAIRLINDDMIQAFERDLNIARQAREGLAMAATTAAAMAATAAEQDGGPDGGPRERNGWDAFSLGVELQRQVGSALGSSLLAVEEDEEDGDGEEVYDSLRFRLSYAPPSGVDDVPLERGALRSVEFGSWVKHPHRKQIANALMRRSSKVPASEAEAWCSAMGLPCQDVAWDRDRRELVKGSAKALSTKKLTRIIPIFQRELRGRLAARPFDVFLDGKSVYDLDRKALEELAVLVDWHLNRRGA